MQSIEDYRAKVVADLLTTNTFAAAWTVWAPQILAKTNKLQDARKVYELGLELNSIFTMTASSGRSQEILSAAGNVWESLVCWYLNLVFSGTRAIAMKQKKALVPECIADCATINYGSDQTNTESDLIVIVFPKGFAFPPYGALTTSFDLE